MFLDHRNIKMVDETVVQYLVFAGAFIGCCFCIINCGTSTKKKKTVKNIDLQRNNTYEEIGQRLHSVSDVDNSGELYVGLMQKPSVYVKDEHYEPLSNCNKKILIVKKSNNGASVPVCLKLSSKGNDVYEVNAEDDNENDYLKPMRVRLTRKENGYEVINCDDEDYVLPLVHKKKHSVYEIEDDDDEYSNTYVLFDDEDGANGNEISISAEQQYMNILSPSGNVKTMKFLFERLASSE